jgi:hypothetical protein
MQIQNNTPTLRFPEFSGEWEKKKLGEVYEKLSSEERPRPINLLYN